MDESSRSSSGVTWRGSTGGGWTGGGGRRQARHGRGGRAHVVERPHGLGELGRLVRERRRHLFDELRLVGRLGVGLAPGVGLVAVVVTAHVVVIAHVVVVVVVEAGLGLVVPVVVPVTCGLLGEQRLVGVGERLLGRFLEPGLGAVGEARLLGVFRRVEAGLVDLELGGDLGLVGGVARVDLGRPLLGRLRLVLDLLVLVVPGLVLLLVHRLVRGLVVRGLVRRLVARSLVVRCVLVRCVLVRGLVGDRLDLAGLLGGPGLRFLLGERAPGLGVVDLGLVVLRLALVGARREQVHPVHVGLAPVPVVDHRAVLVEPHPVRRAVLRVLDHVRLELGEVRGPLDVHRGGLGGPRLVVRQPGQRRGHGGAHLDGRLHRRGRGLGDRQLGALRRGGRAQVRRGGDPGLLGHLGQHEVQRLGPLDQLRLRRHAVGAQVVADRGGPDPVAVGLERHRHHRRRVRVEHVRVEPAPDHRDRRPVQVAQQQGVVGLGDRRPVHRGSTAGARAVEHPGRAERAGRLVDGRRRWRRLLEPSAQPVRHVLVGAREEPHLVQVRLRRRWRGPGRLGAVEVEVVAGRVVKLVAGVGPAAPAVPVHARAQPREQPGHLLGRRPGAQGAVDGAHLGGQLEVPAGRAVLRGHVPPLLRRGPHQRQADLLDQRILLGRVQRLQLGHVQHLPPRLPVPARAPAEPNGVMTPRDRA